MSLKGILQGLGKLITKKAKPSQATGQQRKLITYTPETKKLAAKEIAKKDLVPVNPVSSVIVCTDSITSDNTWLDITTLAKSVDLG